VGDSLAQASHGGTSRAEVLASARLVERLPALMAGLASHEASARCARRWRLFWRGTGESWRHGGPWQWVAQLLGCSRHGGSTVWGRFLLHSAHRQRLDGGSFSEWCRTRAAAERSRGRGGPQRGMSRGESRERRAMQRGETWFLLNIDLATIRIQGAHRQRRDRAATGDTGGTVCAVTGHNGVVHTIAHSD
jgi:hypothetical protein